MDVYLGEDRHVDGTPMEERTVEIELDQTSIRDVIMDKIREHRRKAYNDNVQFVYEWYNRPDMLDNNRHKYRNAESTINDSAPENIHANRSDNIHTAFKAWADREYDALARSNGVNNFGSNVYLHTILNPVYTIYGGSSVTLTDGQSGARANRANVLIGFRYNSVNHTAASAPRVGTYQVDVLTKKNGLKLPGEVTPSEQVDVEVGVDYNSIEEFNLDVAEETKVLHQKGQKGLEINGRLVKAPINEIYHVGPVREVLSQGDLVETFDVNATFNSTVETNPGRDGYV